MWINPRSWLLAPCSGSVGLRGIRNVYSAIKLPNTCPAHKEVWFGIFFFFFSLVLKEEASDYLELDTVKNLVKKYSQFINFPIYVWSSKVSVFNCVLSSISFGYDGCLARPFMKAEGLP